MQNINITKATKAELEAAGYTITVGPSQIKRNRKSLFGVRPSMNNSKGTTKRSLKTANLPATNGTLQG